jgi:beta-lactamase regulating signal transducer with metallopeptidase domain
MLSLQQMSVMGAVMIAVIALLRGLLREKLPKRTFVLLWGLVILRLLLPFALPSGWSIYTAAERGRQAGRGAYTGTASDTEQDGAEITMPEKPDAGQTIATPDVQPTQENTSVVAAKHTADIRFVVWLVGTVCMSCFFAGSYLRYRWIFKTSTPVQNPFVSHWRKTYGIRRTVQVRCTDRIQSPMAEGIFKPLILVPAGMDFSDERRMSYIFLHEYTHIRCGDTVLKKALALALCIHWFNPFVWLMLYWCNRDIELACDEQVVWHFGPASRSDYANMLVELAEHRSSLFTVYNHFGKQAIEERVVSIMKNQKRSAVGVVIAAVLVVGVAGTLATTADMQDDTGTETVSETTEMSSEEPVTDEAQEQTETALQQEDTLTGEQETEDAFERFYDELKSQLLQEIALGNVEFLETRTLMEQVDVGALSGTMELDCYEGDYYICRYMVEDQEIWSMELDFVRMSEKGIYLVRENGINYLLVNVPYQIQGSGNYRYQMFTFDASGKKVLYDERQCDFDYNGNAAGRRSTLLAGDVEAYEQRLQGYLKKSTLLVEARDHRMNFEVDLSDSCRLFEASMPLVNEEVYEELGLGADDLHGQLEKIEAYYAK